MYACGQGEGGDVVLFAFDDFVGEAKEKSVSLACSMLICCGISPAVLHSLRLLPSAETCVFLCVCGRVRLVAEFIYLILNQLSNSLIGPVPLLGNEGK